MLTPIYARRFDKDVKRMKKQRKNMEKLKLMARSLVGEEPIDPIHRDHQLAGNWQGRRECHMESDWLLIYKIEGNRVIFERTGPHSELYR